MYIQSRRIRLVSLGERANYLVNEIKLRDGLKEEPVTRDIGGKRERGIEEIRGGRENDTGGEGGNKRGEEGGRGMM